jgi:hypothetical protein
MSKLPEGLPEGWSWDELNDSREWLRDGPPCPGDPGWPPSEDDYYMPEVERSVIKRARRG